MNIYQLVMNHINKYAKNHKDFDEHFFIELAQIYANYYGLGNYLTLINFREKSPNGELATCVHKSKAIEVFVNDMNDHLVFLYKLLGNYINKKEEHYLSYFGVTHFFIHELIHINQNKIYCENKTTIEDKLVSLEFSLLAKMKEDIANEFIVKNYDSCLTERIAEINSIEFVLKLLRNKFPNLTFYYNELLLKNYYRGYKIERGILVAPTYRTIKKLNRMQGNIEFDYDYLSNNYIDTVNKVKTLDFNTRFKLGLPISTQEYNRY